MKVKKEDAEAMRQHPDCLKKKEQYGHPSIEGAKARIEFDRKVAEQVTRRKEMRKLLDAVDKVEKAESLGLYPLTIQEAFPKEGISVETNALNGTFDGNTVITSDYVYVDPVTLPTNEWEDKVNELTQEANGKHYQDSITDVIEEMRDYHVSTCQDKYHEAEMDTLNLIMSHTHGKSINLFNAFKYMSRYLTEGFDKSDNRKDVMKAIHYLLFELARTK